MSHRIGYFVGFFAVAFLLGGAAFLQIYMGVQPCPLCVLQRIVLGLLGVIFLLGIASSPFPQGRIATGLLSILFSLTGIILSGRQVWLQSLPSTGNENCEASLGYLLQILPFDEAIIKIFEGGAMCSQIGWEFMHISLAQWSLISFIAFLAFAVWQLRGKKNI